MTADTEQHREVLLGNKQLLSIFFVGAVLLGIAFTIGYIMGKNTATKIADGNAAGYQSPVSPSRTGEKAVDSTATRDDSAPSEPQTAASNSEVSPPSKPVEPSAVTAKSSSTVEPAEPPSQARVASGSYLQVAALKRGDAEHVVTTLQRRGFPALVGESSKEGLFRVLVGPFQSMAQLSESKQKLKAAGMDSILVR